MQQQIKSKAPLLENFSEFVDT